MGMIYLEYEQQLQTAYGEKADLEEQKMAELENSKDLISVLWSGADILRSKMDANEYKDYLLGVVFYKYLSDSFLIKVYDMITLHQHKCDELKNIKKFMLQNMFVQEKMSKMGKLILYHGTPDKEIAPSYGGGNDKHDYGRGFYLTESLELAKEWAVCRPNEKNGWVHKFELDCGELNILDLEEKNILSWLAELMKHRDAADSKRYRMLAAKFIDKYGIDTDNYDVIKGWRANASYFYIAKEFVRDNIDMDILEELLSLGGLGIQYCIKTELAYSKLTEIKDELTMVDYSEFNHKYNQRDIDARRKMRDLVNSDENKVTKVFSTLF